ncbi:MAG: nucleotidyl transferase AbiEii/AbiGii toxin family protein [Pseudonocardiaceae bacterium]
MDEYHERLARVGLEALAPYGFCLAGGYAVQAHGLLERPSEDIDLFTTAASEAQFPDATAAAIAAYSANGLAVATLLANPAFARLSVTDPASDDTAKVELAIDWRAHTPVKLTIGPVLHPDDAVANKVCALYSRAQARDYIDVDAALSNRYDGNDLLRLAQEHDPGFDPTTFAGALRAVRRLPLAEFRAYGLPDSAAAALVNRMLQWAIAIETQPESEQQR